MTTIADNIKSMARLVSETKREFHLTEGTVLRIVDMNFALAQSAQHEGFGGDEEIPFDPTLLATDEDGMPVFPATPSDIEAVEEGDDDPETIPTPLN